MCDAVHRGGVCLSTCWGCHTTTPGSRHLPAKCTPQEQTPPRTRYTPWSRHPPGPGTPPRDQVHPLQSMLGDTVNARAVRVLLECHLVSLMFTFNIMRQFTEKWWPPFRFRQFVKSQTYLSTFKI